MIPARSDYSSALSLLSSLLRGFSETYYNSGQFSTKIFRRASSRLSPLQSITIINLIPQNITVQSSE
eukprot:scaffold395_cov265-Chaetoceros_neogracile.AAC.16